ncbi:MAG TPA: SdrD B-like domain-containing protein, partial [Caldilineaceae bacterium]|nr:SdrD B-like domain-containing protein [Caldilineaceae bacterium]
TNAGGSGNATKTYVDLRITLSPLTDINKVGDPHTFTAIVQQNTGSGWASVPNGTTVSFSLLNNTAGATFTTGTSCTTTSGQCTITINGANAGSVDLQATSTVTVNSQSITRTTGTTANTNAGGTGNATKTYVDLRISLSPLTDINKVGDPHTFTAIVQQNTGSSWANVPNGTVVSFSLLNNTAGATFTAGTTCTTTSGQCTITINGANAGSVNLQATTTVVVSSQSITRTTDTTANTNAGGTGNATKTYVDLRISLSPLTDINKVGDPHTFTAIVQQNTGSGWASVPNGTVVSFSLLNNSAGATFTAGTNCTTTSGQCTITINGANAGSVDLQATSTVVVSSQSITRTTATTANTNAGGSGNATKTYVDLRISLSPLTDTNPVNEPHTFTATVQQNTGSGWGNVPNGTTVIFSLLNNTANASFTAGNTCTTTGGQCTITINGTIQGSVNLQATSTVIVSGETITRTTGTTANTNAGGSGNATKIYQSGSIGDFVWWDIDKNGRQDSGEPGINDVTVRLYSNATCTGSPTTSVNTANGGSPATDGFYQFTGLGQGTYCVEIHPNEFTSGGTLENWFASPQNAAGDTIDSDGDLTSKRITNITINPVGGPANDPTNDFGFYKNSGHTVTKVRTSDLSGTGVRINEPISFTVTVVNTGTTWLDVVPISDTYNTNYIQFVSANILGVNTPPTSNQVNAPFETKFWSDITGAGTLAPGASIVLNMVFVGVGDTTLLPPQTPCTQQQFTCNQVSTSTALGAGPSADPDGPGGPLPPSEVIPPKKSDAPAKVVNPTAVALADYGAAITPSSVTLRWTTVNESEISGFDIYRIDSSRASVLVGHLDAQKPGQPSGAAYSLTDSNAAWGVSYTYVLEAQMFGGGKESQTIAKTSYLWLANVAR